MLIQFLNYIKKIFQSTCDNNKQSKITNVLGASYTDLYAYGVIHRVIGDSLTNLQDYSSFTSSDINSVNVDQVQDIIVNDLETISLDDYEDDNVDLEDEQISLSIDNSPHSDDFSTLENILRDDLNSDTNCIINASDVLGKLKGTILYEHLQNSDQVRSKISLLLDRVSMSDPESSNIKNSLLDMSEFLNT